MQTQEHINIGKENMHLPYRWVWNDATARLAQTGLEADDEQKIGFQKSDDTTWVLVDYEGENKWARLDAFTDEHSSVVGGKVHTPFRWTFAIEALRLAEEVTAEDVGKVAFQQLPSSSWVLTNHNPKAWALVGGGSFRWKVDNLTALTALSVSVADRGELAFVRNTNSIYLRSQSDTWIAITEVEDTFPLRFKGVLNPASNLVPVKVIKNLKTGMTTLFFPLRNFSPSASGFEVFQSDDAEANGLIPASYRPDSGSGFWDSVRLRVEDGFGQFDGKPGTVKIEQSGKVIFSFLKYDASEGVSTSLYSDPNGWGNFGRGILPFSVTYLSPVS